MSDLNKDTRVELRNGVYVRATDDTQKKPQTHNPRRDDDIDIDPRDREDRYYERV